jgi:hypothetical protein
MNKFCKKLKYNKISLFLRIVFRIDMSETILMPKLAWEVSNIIYPKKVRDE